MNKQKRETEGMGEDRESKKGGYEGRRIKKPERERKMSAQKAKRSHFVFGFLERGTTKQNHKSFIPLANQIAFH